MKCLLIFKCFSLFFAQHMTLSPGNSSVGTSNSSSGFGYSGNLPTPDPSFQSAANISVPMETVEVLPQHVERYMQHYDQLSATDNMVTLASNAAQGL